MTKCTREKTPSSNKATILSTSEREKVHKALLRDSAAQIAWVSLHTLYFYLLACVYPDQCIWTTGAALFVLNAFLWGTSIFYVASSFLTFNHHGGSQASHRGANEPDGQAIQENHTILHNQQDQSKAKKTKEPRRPTTQSTRQSVWCHYCNTSQPVRSKHCKRCAHCVLRFDHHCYFLGGCVGQQNYKLFIVYLFVQSALVAYCFLSLLGHYDKQQEGELLVDYVWRHGWLNLPTSFAGVVWFFPSLLLLFHLFLFAADKTTYELIKGKREADSAKKPKNH